MRKSVKVLLEQIGVDLLQKKRFTLIRLSKKPRNSLLRVFLVAGY